MSDMPDDDEDKEPTPSPEVPDTSAELENDARLRGNDNLPESDDTREVQPAGAGAIPSNEKARIIARLKAEADASRKRADGLADGDAKTEHNAERGAYLHALNIVTDIDAYDVLRNKYKDPNHIEDLLDRADDAQ